MFSNNQPLPPTTQHAIFLHNTTYGILIEHACSKYYGMSSIQYITTDDFKNNLLLHNGLAIIECCTLPSAELQIMEPIFKRLIELNKNKFKHFRLNVDRHPSLRDNLYVTHTPCFLFFKEGTLIDRIDGLASFSELCNTINKNTDYKKSL